MINSALIAIGVAGLTIGIIAYLYGNKEKRMSRASVQSKSDEKEPAAKDDSPTQTKKSIKDKVKGWWGKSLLVRALVFIALTVGIVWLWQDNRHRLDPDTVGSGQTLLDGSKITIEKHRGEDFSELAKYETVAGGFLTRLETQGEKEVYILVWRRNGNEYVPVTQGPRIYRGEPLSRCAVETYSLFLGDNAQIDKLANVVAKVDTSRRCDAIGNIVAAK